jgi:predicted pyridoxine 5'-phosphate oxidase superfamily flavin-nucleotide-binding protein
MSRLATHATIDAAPAAARPQLEAVEKQIGSVPNLFRLVANSPAALEGYASDVAFTDAVKAIQARKGSRAAYARMEAAGSWERYITPDLKAEIEAQTSVFLATASAEGQPYIQHRGGPAGFLRVLDEQTIGFADFAGNRQYITQGNLEENPRAQLLLIDYTNRRRI